MKKNNMFYGSGGSRKMKIKIVGLFVCMLLITTILPMTAIAGDEEHPEITDNAGDAFGYIDINSVWFFEKERTPEFLYVSEKINGPSKFVPQQTFAVCWTHKNIEYACVLGMGFRLEPNWKSFAVAIDNNSHEEIIDINGTYNFATGIITWEIPKEIIGNPHAGDILTHTWSNAFRRLGFIGRIGLTRTALDIIILLVFGNNMWDYAPTKGEFGLDYVIQY
jgi:hypothetical protein